MLSEERKLRILEYINKNHAVTAAELMKKYNKQGKYALSRHENISRDTIDTGRKAAKGQDVEYNKAYGRFKACDQPGRYEY